MCVVDPVVHRETNASYAIVFAPVSLFEFGEGESGSFVRILPTIPEGRNGESGSFFGEQLHETIHRLPVGHPKEIRSRRKKKDIDSVRQVVRNQQQPANIPNRSSDQQQQQQQQQTNDRSSWEVPRCVARSPSPCRRCHRRRRRRGRPRPREEFILRSSHPTRHRLTFPSLPSALLFFFATFRFTTMNSPF
jgi:hypothetical protein